jgi:membrane protease YdiL (CAAX protease family)
MTTESIQPKQSRRRIVTYISITFTLAIASYAFIALGREEGGGLGPWAILLQWAPAIGAFATLLIYQRNVRGLGFGLGKGRYLVLSYFLPLAVLLVTYAVIWLLGLGGFDSETVLKETEASLGISSPILLMLANIVVTGTAGVLLAAIFALGEEIGWRGFLVPELAITRSFTGVALISGVIWALFHFPFVFIFGGERAGTPIPYQLLVMTIQAIAISTIVAWIRLMSGSLWTAVIFHSVLNPFGQGLFTNLTTNTGITPYIAGEQGLALAITWSIVAIMFWLKRDSLPQFQSQDDALVSEALDSEVQPNSV